MPVRLPPPPPRPPQPGLGCLEFPTVFKCSVCSSVFLAEAPQGAAAVCPGAGGRLRLSGRSAQRLPHAGGLLLWVQYVSRTHRVEFLSRWQRWKPEPPDSSRTFTDSRNKLAWYCCSGGMELSIVTSVLRGTQRVLQLQRCFYLVIPVLVLTLATISLLLS